MPIILRAAHVDDADELASLVQNQRPHLAPWEPARPDVWFTPAGQRAALKLAKAAREADLAYHYLIVDDADSIIGRVNLASVVRGAGQFCSIGYWVAREFTGQGVATAAVAHAVGIAFNDLGLHRVQAETLIHNAASQRVLARNGFERYGMAPAYLRIEGRWQDHVLYQRINPTWTPLEGHEPPQPKAPLRTRPPTRRPPLHH